MLLALNGRRERSIANATVASDLQATTTDSNSRNRRLSSGDWACCGRDTTWETSRRPHRQAHMTVLRVTGALHVLAVTLVLVDVAAACPHTHTHTRYAAHAVDGDSGACRQDLQSLCHECVATTCVTAALGGAARGPLTHAVRTKLEPSAEPCSTVGACGSGAGGRRTVTVHSTADGGTLLGAPHEQTIRLGQLPLEVRSLGS